MGSLRLVILQGSSLLPISPDLIQPRDILAPQPDDTGHAACPVAEVTRLSHLNYYLEGQQVAGTTGAL